MGIVVALLPGYISLMTADLDFGSSCAPDDSKNKNSEEGLFESVEICTEITSEVKKKFFGVIWLPVYKWGMNVAQLHYASFFIWVAAVLYVLLYS